MLLQAQNFHQQPLSDIQAQSLLSLSEKFKESTQDNEEIKEAFAKLQTWINVRLPNVSYEGTRISGTLKKRVQEFRFFQKKIFPKRFWIIDFSYGTVVVKHDPQCSKESSVFYFREIEDCFLPEDDKEQQLRDNVSMSRFRVPFYLKTKQRTTLLFSSSEKERTMWMAAFKYVILSTREVQKIINSNLQRGVFPQAQQVQEPTQEKLEEPRKANDQSASGGSTQNCTDQPVLAANEQSTMGKSSSKHASRPTQKSALETTSQEEESDAKEDEPKQRGPSCSDASSQFKKEREISNKRDQESSIPSKPNPITSNSPVDQQVDQSTTEKEEASVANLKAEFEARKVKRQLAKEKLSQAIQESMQLINQQRRDIENIQANRAPRQKEARPASAFRGASSSPNAPQETSSQPLKKGKSLATAVSGTVAPSAEAPKKGGFKKLKIKLRTRSRLLSHVTTQSPHLAAKPSMLRSPEEGVNSNSAFNKQMTEKLAVSRRLDYGDKMLLGSEARLRETLKLQLGGGDDMAKSQGHYMRTQSQHFAQSPQWGAGTSSAVEGSRGAQSVLGKSIRPEEDDNGRVKVIDSWVNEKGRRVRILRVRRRGQSMNL